MYFAGEPLNETDRIIQTAAANRHRLIAPTADGRRPTPDESPPALRWGVPLLVLGLVLVVLLAPIVLLPLSIVQRYRVGTARRPARAWLATLNTMGFGVSAGLALLVAALTSWWAPGTLTATVAGMCLGLLLGTIGLWSSRWESTAGILHFTPNRWLVLAVTAVVVARLVYGMWRGWQAWAAPGDGSWLATAGVAGSLAAGAVVIGYGCAFWGGVRWRIGRRRAARILSI